MHQLLSILTDPKRQSNPLTSSVMDLRGVGKYIQTLTSTIAVINSNVFWRCSSLYPIDWVSRIQAGGREACNEILWREPKSDLLKNLTGSSMNLELAVKMHFHPRDVHLIQLIFGTSWSASVSTFHIDHFCIWDWTSSVQIHGLNMQSWPWSWSKLLHLHH